MKRFFCTLLALTLIFALLGADVPVFAGSEIETTDEDIVEVDEDTGELTAIKQGIAVITIEVIAQPFITIRVVS